MTQRQPRSTLFPYTTLFRSAKRTSRSTGGIRRSDSDGGSFAASHVATIRISSTSSGGAYGSARTRSAARDRKSTRLNSSHGYISYAVFCLKKKKIHEEAHRL